MRCIVTVIAMIVLAALPVQAAVHVISQVSVSFVPAVVSIVIGDTVRWTWSDLSHTVTSGTGAADSNVGSLFDAPLNSSNASFEYTYNTPGLYPFFCRPHEVVNMKGSVFVDAPVPNEPMTWSGIKSFYIENATTRR